MEINPIKEHYSSISKRIKAAVIDSIFVILLSYFIANSLDLFEGESIYIKLISFFIIFLLYDPLMTSIMGGTVGHFLMNLMVKQENTKSERISFPKALLRFILKFTLGWFSLLSINTNPKKQAIHDMAVKSVVVSV